MCVYNYARMCCAWGGGGGQQRQKSEDAKHIRSVGVYQHQDMTCRFRSFCFKSKNQIISINKVVLEPLVSPDLAIYIFKQVKVKMTLDLVMSP